MSICEYVFNYESRYFGNFFTLFWDLHRIKLITFTLNLVNDSRH